jgi:hypothetical protein
VKGPGDKSKVELKPELHDFGVLAADVDVCLHDYRYRESKEIPKLKSRKVKVLTNTLSKGVRKNCVGRDLNKFMIDNKPVVVFNSSLENNYMSLRNADVEKHYPLANKHKVGKALIGKLTIGDMLAVRLEQKCIKAEVLEVVPQMNAAYISFEDYPSVYDEYQPFDLLRLPSGDEITHDDIKPGLVVLGEIQDSYIYMVARDLLSFLSLVILTLSFYRILCINLTSTIDAYIKDFSNTNVRIVFFLAYASL